MVNRRLRLTSALVLLVLAFCVSACALTCASCSSNEPKKIQGRPELCADACKNLEALGCEEAKPIPAPPWQKMHDGQMVTCTEFCVDIEKSGIVTLDPECAMNIKACGELQSCTKPLAAKNPNAGGAGGAGGSGGMSGAGAAGAAN